MVTNIAAGHQWRQQLRGPALEPAVAVGLALSYLQVWRDRPIRGTSHPKEFRCLLDLLARSVGATPPRLC